MVLLAVLAVARAVAQELVELVALEQAVKEVMVATITRLPHLTVVVAVVLQLLVAAVLIQTTEVQELPHLFLAQVLVMLAVVVLAQGLVEQAVLQLKVVVLVLLLRQERLEQQTRAVVVVVQEMALSVMAVTVALVLSLFDMLTHLQTLQALVVD